MYRLSSYREWKDPEAVAKEINRKQKFRQVNNLDWTDPMSVRELGRFTMILQGHTT